MLDFHHLTTQTINKLFSPGFFPARVSNLDRRAKVRFRFTVLSPRWFVIELLRAARTTVLTPVIALYGFLDKDN